MKLVQTKYFMWHNSKANDRERTKNKILLRTIIHFWWTIETHNCKPKRKTIEHYDSIIYHGDIYLSALGVSSTVFDLSNSKIISHTENWFTFNQEGKRETCMRLPKQNEPRWSRSFIIKHCQNKFIELKRDSFYKATKTRKEKNHFIFDSRLFELMSFVYFILTSIA